MIAGRIKGKRKELLSTPLMGFPMETRVLSKISKEKLLAFLLFFVLNWEAHENDTHHLSEGSSWELGAVLVGSRAVKLQAETLSFASCLKYGEESCRGIRAMQSIKDGWNIGERNLSHTVNSM